MSANIPSMAPSSAKSLAVTQSGGEEAGPTVRKSTFYLYIVLAVLVLLLAFAAWGSYMARTRRSMHRTRDPDVSNEIVSAEKLERPSWLDAYLGSEETSAREALPVSAIVVDDPPNVEFPLHCSRLLPTVHARPTMIARSTKADVQLVYVIAMPNVPPSSSSSLSIVLGVRRTNGRLLA
ncbi:hypothetical protein PENSPDRAFT_104802 [Peniophora sp. CONT]|nr:hypothetical protein PENSPDRAFT_104802 [Peniophora sp. CONT]